MKHVKLFEEFASGVTEGYSGNFPKDITLTKTKKVAEEVAKAMNMIAEPGEEYKVNTKTIDNASFDLDVVRNGMVDEYDGGSYNLYDDGSIVNMATWDRKTGESPVFGDWRKDNAKKIADNVKKMMNESLTEAKDLRSLQKALDKLQNDYEAVLDDETLDAMSELIMAVNSKL